MSAEASAAGSWKRWRLLLPKRRQTGEAGGRLTSAGSTTFVDEKLGKQGRQLHGVAGVGEAGASVPLETVHLRVPLHPVEGEAPPCPWTRRRVRAPTVEESQRRQGDAALTFQGGDKADSALGLVGGQDGEEAPQPLVGQKALEDQEPRHLNVCAGSPSSR